MSDRARLEKFQQLSDTERLALYGTGVREVRRYRNGLKKLKEGLKNATVPPAARATWALSLVEALLEGREPGLVEQPRAP